MILIQALHILLYRCVLLHYYMCICIQNFSKLIILILTSIRWLAMPCFFMNFCDSCFCPSKVQNFIRYKYNRFIMKHDVYLILILIKQQSTILCHYYSFILIGNTPIRQKYIKFACNTFTVKKKLVALLASHNTLLQREVITLCLLYHLTS